MKKVVIGSLFVSVLSGCAATMGNKVDVNKFDKVVSCKTTKSEIISLLGEPERQGRQNGYNTLNWQYASAGPFGQESQNVVVFLNNKNVLVDYTINPIGLIQPTDNCKI